MNRGSGFQHGHNTVGRRFGRACGFVRCHYEVGRRPVGKFTCAGHHAHGAARGASASFRARHRGDRRAGGVAGVDVMHASFFAMMRRCRLGAF
jgi:hypothetical protein